MESRGPSPPSRITPSSRCSARSWTSRGRSMVASSASAAPARCLSTAYRSSLASLPALVGDAEVTTVEGLATGERLDPLQTAFAEEGAAQCGYCTPGMLMTAKALLDTTARPTRDEIAHAISGNLCRCTGYTAIYAAI